MRWMSLVLLAACNSGSDRSPYADGSLAPPSVQPDEELSSSRKDLSGSISAQGSGENVVVKITTANGRTEVEVTGAANPDLSVIDGIEGQLSLAEHALSDEVSLLVSDETGPLYLLETVDSTVLTSTAFGSGFVQVGADVGTVPIDLDQLRLYSATFQTDDGVVEAFPGEPVEAVIDGLSYRIVLLASWVRERSSDRDSQCFQLDEILSYEVTRVEPGTADLAPLTRAETAPIDGGSCSP